METIHELGIFVERDTYIEAFLLGTYTSARHFGW